MAQCLGQFGLADGMSGGDLDTSKRKRDPPKKATVATLKPLFPAIHDELLQDVATSSDSDWNLSVSKLLAMGFVPDYSNARAATAPVKEATAATLKEHFPDADVSLLRDTADDCKGSWDEAVSRLLSYGLVPACDRSPRQAAKRASVPKCATAETLGAAFPDVEKDVLRDVLDNCRGKWDAAVQQLANFGFTPVDGDGDTRCDDLPHEVSWRTESSEFSDDGYDNALATGEDLRRYKASLETSELMKQNLARIQTQMKATESLMEEQAHQRRLGPQSSRGMTKAELASSLSRGSNSSFAKKCFDTMLEREAEHCGEYVVFYHSYSFAAIMYEVQAAIARVLYSLPQGFGALPRLLKEPFNGKPHISLLLASFSSMSGQDHNTVFRQLAISVSVSLLAPASEAPPISSFENGYSCTDLSFRGIMTTLFTTLGLTQHAAERLTDEVERLGQKWGLAIHERASSSKQGHMLQMFVATDVVDDLAYASHAMGVVDPSRNPLSKSLTGKKWPDGQARVFVHPSLFLDPRKVKLYHYTANENLHRNRVKFQNELINVLSPILGNPDAVLRAFKAIEGRGL